jgi:hypothetical protein
MDVKTLCVGRSQTRPYFFPSRLRRKAHPEKSPPEGTCIPIRTYVMRAVTDVGPSLCPSNTYNAAARSQVTNFGGFSGWAFLLPPVKLLLKTLRAGRRVCDIVYVTYATQQ